jgi:hypothetical protein
MQGASGGLMAGGQQLWPALDTTLVKVLTAALYSHRILRTIRWSRKGRSDVTNYKRTGPRACGRRRGTAMVGRQDDLGRDFLASWTLLTIWRSRVLLVLWT